MVTSSTELICAARNIKEDFKDLIFYLVFLLITTLVILKHSSLYWLTSVVEQEFIDDEFELDDGTEINIYQIGDMESLWVGLDNILFESFYWDYWYEDSKRKIPHKEIIPNKILGVPRLRQKRIQSNTCKIHKIFSKSIEYCNEKFSSKYEDKADFGLKNSTAWTYHTEDELKGISYYSDIATYDGSGFYQDLSSYTTQTRRILKYLKRNDWLTSQTRVLFVDFNIYNGNINAFCLVKIIFEFPPTGGVFTSKNISTLKLIHYATKFDYFILGCELIFIGYLVYYTRMFQIRLCRLRLYYFKMSWSYVDIIIIFLSYIYICLRIYIFVLMMNRIEEQYRNPHSFVNFEKVEYWHRHLNNVFGVLLFCIWLKLFKFVNINKTLAQLNSTLRKCARYMYGFIIVFVLVFLTYSQLGFLLFGAELSDFCTLGKSTLTLFKTLHGVFDYKEIEKCHEILGPAFFISYIFFVFFLLLNMFLAIINDSYTLVKNEITSGTADQEGLMFLKRGFLKLLPYKCIKTACESFIEIQKEENNLKKLLKMCEYKDFEIDLLFSKYKFDANTDIENETIREFTEEVVRMNFELCDAVNYVRSKDMLDFDIIPEDLEKFELELMNLERNIEVLEEKINNLVRNLP